MSTPRPRRWAVSAVDAATLLIPPGSIRRRYRHELVSELWGMSTAQQLTHAVSLLVAAPALHRALVESGELDVPHSPLWCRLHLHHRWRIERTLEGTTLPAVPCLRHRRRRAGPRRQRRRRGLRDDRRPPQLRSTPPAEWSASYRGPPDGGSVRACP